MINRRKELNRKELTIERYGSGKKGQLFSLDFIASLITFFIILIFLVSLWNLYSLRLNNNEKIEELQITAFQITDILTKSAGIPELWERQVSNVSVIGLVKAPGVLSEDKVTALLMMDYNTSKKKWGIDNEEYSFQILDSSGAIVASSGSTPENNKEIVSLRRYVKIENETRQLVFTTWEKS